MKGFKVVILELLYMIALMSVLFFFINYLHKKGKLKFVFAFIAVVTLGLLCADDNSCED